MGLLKRILESYEAHSGIAETAFHARASNLNVNNYVKSEYAGQKRVQFKEKTREQGKFVNYTGVLLATISIVTQHPIEAMSIAEEYYHNY